MKFPSDEIVRPALKPPMQPKKFAGRALPDPQLTSYGRYSQLLLTNDQFNQQSAQRLTFDQMLCKQLGFQGSELSSIQVSDSRFLDCDLVNASWGKADFARVEFLSCRLTGFRSIESRLQDVFFKDCQLELAQFRFVLCKGARFENCDLSDADFQGADLTGVLFINCNLSRVEMSGAKLQRADLRGCKIEETRVGWTELQGATIDAAQALALVRAQGIRVE